MKNLTRCAAAATAALLLTVVFVSAQERREQDKAKPAQPNTQRQPDNRTPQQPAQPFHGQGAQNQGDRQLSACLISDNEGEVVLAKFALQKSQNAKVKEFAEQMSHDHGEFLKKLSQFAPLSTASHESGATAPEARRDSIGTTAAEDRSTENRPANAPQRPQNNRDADPQSRPNQAQAPGTRPNPPTAVAGQVDLVRIKQEIGRQCVETMKKELGEKKGAEFDKCYMGMQVGAHLHMADTLKVVKNYASPQLRTVLEDGEKTAAEHLDHAKHLLKDLEGDKRTERTAAKEDE